MTYVFPEEQREWLSTVQGWCPECGGSGMVMRYQPEDCPNVWIHKFLQSLEYMQRRG